MLRISPEEYFNQPMQESNSKMLIYLGLIVLGVVACVAITAIAIRGGKN